MASGLLLELQPRRVFKGTLKALWLFDAFDFGCPPDQMELDPPHLEVRAPGAGVSLKVTVQQRRREAGQEPWHSARDQALTFHLKRGDLKERRGR